MATATGTVVVRWGLAGEELLAPLGPSATGAELRRWLVEQKKVSERYTLKLSIPASPEQCEDKILLDDEVVLGGSVIHAILKNGPSRFYMPNPQPTTAKLGQKMTSYDDKVAPVLDDVTEDDFSGWHSSEGRIVVHDRPIRDLQSADVSLELREKVLELAKLIEGIRLPGSESDFEGTVFALFKGDDLKESLLEALGIIDSIKGEVTLNEKEFRSSFTFCDDEDENNLRESSNDEYERLVSATNILKKFGKTYELNFNDEVVVAPVLYFAANAETDEIIGIMGGRVWT